MIHTVIISSLLVLFSNQVLAENGSHQPRKSSSVMTVTYRRPSVATPSTPPRNQGVPIPKGLARLYGPNASLMSSSERMQEEMRIYLEDSAYNKYMTQKIQKAAERVGAGSREKFRNMTLKDLVKKWRMENPELNVLELATSLAVLEVGSSSVLGKMEPSLCKTTNQYARRVAQADYQLGHADLSRRFAQLRSQYGKEGRSVHPAENEAESSAMLGSSLMEHAQECVRSWEYSEGHRAAMNAYHSLACHSMARGRSGKYFCIGQFIN